MDLKFVSIDTFVVQFIVLLIVLWVLNKYIFRPYLSYLDEWEEKQSKLENDYKNIDKLIEDANVQKDKMLEDARKKSSEIIEESESIWNKKRQNIIEKAEKEAKDLIFFSKWEIEKERLWMLATVKTQLVDLILKFNSKLFKEWNISKDYLEKELSNIK